jgi:hypothetical protein
MDKVGSIIDKNGVVFYLEEKMMKVIDKYDDKLQASFKEESYNYLTSYEGEVKELDLSWISVRDVIDLKANEGLGKVFVNCTNTKNAKIKSNSKFVCDINVDCNVVAAGSALKRFLNNNKDVINKINYHRVTNPIIMSYLKDMSELFGIECEFIKLEEIILPESIELDAVI